MELLAFARSHALSAIEIRVLENTTDLPRLFSRDGLASLRLARQAYPSVEILSLSTDFKLVGSQEAERDGLIAFVPWAEALGVPWLRVFDGGNPDNDLAPMLAAETFDWWRQLRAARQWRVDLLVETHDALLTRSRLTEFFARAGDVALLWDSHHTWRHGGEAPEALWPAIAAQVRHIHVKDSVDRPSGKPAYSYVLPGKGEFPMQKLRAALDVGGYSRTVSLEWEKHWHQSLPPLEDALCAAAAGAWW